MNKPRLLLHCCCAPCGAFVADFLNGDAKPGFAVTGYFYNPNIQPPSEYEKRLREVGLFFEKNNLPLIVGHYDSNQWLAAIKGLENEPEGGARCRVCYEFRLKETARLAKEKNFEYFAATLTISPHKKAEVINPIGEQLAQEFNLKFYPADFKKKDGFKKANELAREQGFYRQNYCGCVLAKIEADKRR